MPSSEASVEVTQAVSTRTEKASDVKENEKSGSTSVTGKSTTMKGNQGKQKISSLSSSKESEEVDRRTKKRSIEETDASTT